MAHQARQSPARDPAEAAARAHAPSPSFNKVKILLFPRHASRDPLLLFTPAFLLSAEIQREEEAGRVLNGAELVDTELNRSIYNAFERCTAGVCVSHSLIRLLKVH